MGQEGERMTLAKQRARRAEDKEIRRRDIMQAALALLGKRRFAEIKMAEIAQEANLAKGTLFLYFPTKEALFLEILEDLLAEWLIAVDQQLDSGRGRWTGMRVARIITDTLVARDTLTRLFTLVSSVLEQNVDVERVAAFKRKLMELLTPTGTRLEQRLPFLAAGEGIHLLLRIYAVVVGVRQLCDPGAVAQQALERPELAPLVFHFENELRPLLGALLRGFEHDASP
jgi:AcrR family transcriptional regulator